MGRRRAFASERDEPVKQRLQRLDAADRNEANTAPAGLLRLQRSVGNEAVAGVVARDVWKTTGPPAKERKRKYPRRWTMKFEGMDESKIEGGNPGSRTPTTGEGASALDSLHVTVSIETPLCLELQKRSTSGTPLGKAVVNLGGELWTLEETWVDAIRFGSSDTADVTLTYSKFSVDA